ncbi:hypothetical protein M0813_20237 [Anaeramoeba flamelloides]|uniref:Uncharacterized protein n=1 Tax=Anaeramoeba flamelloides TaxID=1746091 RepID=A0ABQ8YMQ3_9EUKA|nr:hypothetical protein M0813_20237 [Anaeramoeba flamelloides]
MRRKTNTNYPKTKQPKALLQILFTDQILLESGKVRSLANGNLKKEVPILDVEHSTFEKIRPVTFFEELKLFVNSLISSSVYYLCNGDQLYVLGSLMLMVFLVLTKMQAVKRCLSVFKKRLPKSLQGMDSWNFNFNTSQPDLLYACWRELLFRTVETDIAQLYQDDDSRDFEILVKTEDDENDDNQEGKNEDENKERNYQYTDSFYWPEVTCFEKSHQDPKLIVNELPDAVENHQLNDQCNFENELFKIKKQFDLNILIFISKISQQQFVFF